MSGGASALRARLASFLALRSSFCFAFSSSCALSRLAFMARRMDMFFGVEWRHARSRRATRRRFGWESTAEEEQCGAQLVLSGERALASLEPRKTWRPWEDCYLPSGPVEAITEPPTSSASSFLVCLRKLASLERIPPREPPDD